MSVGCAGESVARPRTTRAADAMIETVTCLMGTHLTGKVESRVDDTRERSRLQASGRPGAFHERARSGSQSETRAEGTHMASIRKEIEVEAPADDVWAAVRDVGAPHRCLGPGFLTDTRLEGNARIVTFANGLVARELIVDVDDESRRFAWAVVGSPRLHHHNASMQVFADGPRRSRLVWIADLLPDEMA